jgi:heat shock protein HslJ
MRNLVLAIMMLWLVFGPGPTVLAATPPPTEELLMLRANAWQWVAFTNPVEAFAIDDPSRYTVAFHDDATVTIGADCNQALGSYQGEGGVLEITLGPMTAAACPEGSRGEELVRLLGGAALYFFQDGHLFIDLQADGGTLEFAPVSPVAAAEDAELPQIAPILGNLTYNGVIGAGPVALVGGTASYTEPGSSGTPVVRLVSGVSVLGDLNHDGIEDAVAVLEDDADGTGRFTFLAPVLSVLATPATLPAVMAGDRIQIVSLVMDQGEVVLEMITQGPSDPACCGATRARVTYALQDGALVEQTRQDLGRIAFTDLDGTQWRLVDIGDAGAPLPPDVTIILAVSGEVIVGFAGCNTYRAAVSMDPERPQAITVGPIATTRKLCPEPVASLEQQVLDRLQHSTAWGYENGNLAFAFTDGSGSGRMLFAPSLA